MKKKADVIYADSPIKYDHLNHKYSLEDPCNEAFTSENV